LVKSTNIYFNNHFSGYAVKNSLMMMNKLDIKPRNNPEDINALEIRNKKFGRLSKEQTTLDKYFE